MQNDNNDSFEFSKVKISQIDPPTELTDLEKTAIMQFRLDEQEKESVNDKEITNLSNTLILKLKNLHNNADNNKKSLYETVILKLEEIIKKNNSLEIKHKLKVEKSTKLNSKKHKRLLPISYKHINVDNINYDDDLYKLSKIAIKNLSNETNLNVNKTRLGKQGKKIKIDNVHVNKTNYDQYQNKLNEFAVDNLYYKFAPRETKKYKLYKLCLTFSICIFLFTSLIIGNWLRQGYSIKQLEKDITESTTITKVEDGSLYNMDESIEENKYGSQYWQYLNTPLSSVDFTQLLKQNSDTVGWIIVNNTNINYPVVQTSNNDFYLDHAYDKSSNNAGWIYADFRDNFNVLNQNLVIYGHGRKDKIMFGSLTNSLNKEWYTKEENQIIQLSTLKYNTMWQIFSVYTIEAESYYITTDFESNQEYTEFLNTILSRSIYNFGVNMSTNDKVLTLSTCYNDNGIRLVVHAKLVKIQER